MADTIEATEGNQNNFAIVHLRFRTGPARAGLFYVLAGGGCLVIGNTNPSCLPLIYIFMGVGL